jgi:hypothetical protein
MGVNEMEKGDGIEIATLVLLAVVAFVLLK